MRPSVGAGLLLLAAVAGGCDSEQPAVVSIQNATLDFRASGATTTNNRTWFMFEDSNSDNMPDDVNADGTPDTFLWCEPITSGGQATVTANSAPWNFTVTVKLLRPGETSPTVLVENLANSPARARYDAEFEANPSLHSNTIAASGLILTHPSGQCELDSSIPCNPNQTTTSVCLDNNAGTCLAFGTCSGDQSQICNPSLPGQSTCERLGLGSCDIPNAVRRFRFLNDGTRRLRSTANETLLLAPPNILYVTDPAFANLVKSDATGAVSTGGICPGDYLGPAMAGGQPLPLEFTLDKGSTLIVEARRLQGAPGGNIPFFTNPGLSAFFTVDGAQANVVGNTSAGVEDGAFIQFYFQSQ